MLTQSNAGLLPGPSADLELVNYGAGYAWLRPEPQPEPCAAASRGARYALTQRGQDLLNRWRAERWLFGAEVS